MNTLKLEAQKSNHRNGYRRNGVELFTLDPVKKARAKMLIDGIPCDYQYGMVSGDWGSISNVSFIRCNNKAIESSVGQTEVISEVKINADEFEPTIMNLMSNPPEGVEFIRYEETTEKVVPRPDIRILFLRLRQAPIVSKIHHFTLLRTKVEIPK